MSQEDGPEQVLEGADDEVDVQRLLGLGGHERGLATATVRTTTITTTAAACCWPAPA